MIRKTKAIEKIEARMEDVEPGSLRYETLDCAKKFKIYWIELGRYLYTIWKDKHYRAWGYISFETYCVKEIGIKHTTASKLLKSYCFLEREEPHFLRQDFLSRHRPSDMPSYESVNLLRLAKANKGITESDYKRIRESAIDKGKEPSEVRQVIRSVVERAQDKDPEEVYRNRCTSNIRRLITLIKQVSREAEHAGMLRKVTINDLARLVSKLESEISK